MDKQTLKARSALDGYQLELDGFHLVEISDTQLISLSFSPSNAENAKAQFSELFSITAPEVGNLAKSTQDEEAAYKIEPALLGLQRDQYWLLTTQKSSDLLAALISVKDPLFYTSDQSDGWSLLSVSGQHTPQVMERVCQLDLHHSVFDNMTVARTSIEHMSAVIFRSTQSGFMILTPRSLAHSLVHALEHTAKHVIAEESLATHSS